MRARRNTVEDGVVCWDWPFCTQQVGSTRVSVRLSAQHGIAVPAETQQSATAGATRHNTSAALINVRTFRSMGIRDVRNFSNADADGLHRQNRRKNTRRGAWCRIPGTAAEPAS